MDRRGFLTGLAAALAAPVVAPAAVGEAMVEAANQIGHQIVITPAPRGFQVGDVITIEGVERNGVLRQFVVTAETPINGRVLAIYPPLVPESLDGVQGMCVTVDECPKAGSLVEHAPVDLSQAAYDPIMVTSYPGGFWFHL